MEELSQESMHLRRFAPEPRLFNSTPLSSTKVSQLLAASNVNSTTNSAKTDMAVLGRQSEQITKNLKLKLRVKCQSLGGVCGNLSAIKESHLHLVIWIIYSGV